MATNADIIQTDCDIPAMARRGWKLMPIAAKQKNPGTLLGPGWQDQASNDPDQIERWIEQHGQCNWGVLLGEASGIIDVEDDSPEGRSILETAMDTCAVRTPCYTSGKSIHRIFQHDERMAKDSCSVMQAFGTEWRFGKTPAQSVVPPSVHESGKRYQWLPGLSPDEVEVARLPDAMWQLFLDLRKLDAERKKEERDKKRSQTKSEKKPVSAAMQLRIGGHTSHVPAAEELIEMYPWEKLLTDQGWQAFGDDDWTRPGNDWSNARSATLLHSDNRLHVWTNAAPIDEGHYSKWRFWYQSHGFNDHEQIDAAKAFLGDERSKKIDDAFRRENKLKDSTAAGIDASVSGEQESDTQEGKWCLKSVWNAVRSPSPMREVIIAGLARRGEVINIVASTKVGKSWLALMLAFSVATGREWFGRQTKRGRVLLLDNELHDETIQNRMKSVSDAMRIYDGDEREAFEYVDLRGEPVGLGDVETQLSAFKPGELTLVVLDAKYRFFGTGMQENSNDDQTTFHNGIDRLAKQLNCVIVLIHHSTKGDQGGKSITDVGSGGGAQSRTVDCHMVLRPHNDGDDLAVLDAAVRTFAPVSPQTLRWEFPLWSLDGETEPVVKQAQTRNDATVERSQKTKIGTILDMLKRSPDRTATENKLSGNNPSRTAFRAALTELETSGEIEFVPDYIPPRRTEIAPAWRLREGTQFQTSTHTPHL